MPEKMPTQSDLTAESSLQSFDRLLYDLAELIQALRETLETEKDNEQMLKMFEDLMDQLSGNWVSTSNLQKLLENPQVEGNHLLRALDNTVKIRSQQRDLDMKFDKILRQQEILLMNQKILHKTLGQEFFDFPANPED